MSKVREWLTAYGFIAPAMIAILLVSVYPLFFGVSIAFTDMSVFNYLSKEYKFVGFANFSAMLHDQNLDSHLQNRHLDRHQCVLARFSGYCFCYAPFKTMAEAKTNFPSHTHTSLGIPSLYPYRCGTPCSTSSWSSESATSNGRLKPYSVAQQPYLGFVAVVLTNVWLGVPFMMLIALGGLNSIQKRFKKRLTLMERLLGRPHAI